MNGERQMKWEGGTWTRRKGLKIIFRQFQRERKEKIEKDAKSDESRFTDFANLRMLRVDGHNNLSPSISNLFVANECNNY